MEIEEKIKNELAEFDESLDVFFDVELFDDDGETSYAGEF